MFDPPRRAKEASQRARGWHLAIAAALLFGGLSFEVHSSTFVWLPLQMTGRMNEFAN